MKQKNKKPGQDERTNIFVVASVILNYLVLTLFGSMRDAFGRVTGISRYSALLAPKPETDNETVNSTWNGASGKRNGSSSVRKFPMLLRTEESFYPRRVFHRIRDCWDRPICSSPGAYIDLLPRYTNDNNKSLHVPDEYLDSSGKSDKLRDKTKIRTALNLGSYNYLGFGDNWAEICGPDVLPAMKEKGVVATSTALEAGYTDLHKELEELVANFLHKEAALVFSMGYATNQTVLSSLLEAESVVISDSLNHTSIVNGCRGAKNVKILPFKHNDLKMLENLLAQLVLCGQSYPELPDEANFLPWKRVVVVVEGIYSMEGDICRLPEINSLCKKYKAFIYLDEAHSIGAMGATGRGICEHAGVPFKDVDILMGTFSKSFAGMGGYVAGDKAVVDKLRAICSGQTSMSPLSTTVTKQVLTAFKVINSPAGAKRIKNLHDNANYMRKKLKQMGCVVLGDEDSPIIPVMLFYPTKISAFSREMLKRGKAVVVVGFPATPVYEARVRFCISAGHNHEDISEALTEIKTVSKMLNLRYDRSVFG